MVGCDSAYEKPIQFEYLAQPGWEVLNSGEGFFGRHYQPLTNISDQYQPQLLGSLHSFGLQLHNGLCRWPTPVEDLLAFLLWARGFRLDVLKTSRNKKYSCQR
jgi:hypothetical protein